MIIARHLCANAASRAVRPVSLKVIYVAKSASKGAAELLCQEWALKIQRYASFSELQIKPNPTNAKDIDHIKSIEGTKILKALQTPGDRLIALDERGRNVTSHDIADIIAKAGDDGISNLVFTIGGPYGLSEDVRNKADDVIRLSSLVLNHQVAKIVLYEQLYRGWTILRGEPYHH